MNTVAHLLLSDGRAAGCPPSTGRAPSLAALSMRDEEICLYARKGLSAEGIAYALKHPLPVVESALYRAQSLGISLDVRA